MPNFMSIEALGEKRRRESGAKQANRVKELRAWT